MTVKINASTSDGLKLESDTSGTVDIQSNGTTKFTVGTTIDCQGNELVLDADADTSITADTDDRIDFKTAGTDRVHFTSQGNVGVGTNAPTHLADAYKTIEVKGTDTNGSGVILATSTAGIQTQMISSDAVGVGTIGTRTNHPCTFSINNAEKMRIATDGQIYIGTTVERNNSFVCIKSDATNQNGMEIRCHANNDAIRFYSSDSTSAGAVTVSGSSTTYSTSSDYRLKENVDYTFDATTRLKQLKPCRFNWIADNTNTELDGFIAHEVSSIVPEAIIGEKDAIETYTDDDGEEQTREKYQGIDQAKLVPLLVKTIQELEARITALES
jgi:hypothetical protein